MVFQIYFFVYLQSMNIIYGIFCVRHRIQSYQNPIKVVISNMDYTVRLKKTVVFEFYIKLIM